MWQLRMEKPLAGHVVFLSASVPSEKRAAEYRRIRDAFTRVEEAVLRVAGAVFNAGGGLVFGGHPSISPLVGYLCADYQTDELAGDREPAAFVGGQRSRRPSVTIWQSEVFRDSWAEPSKQLKDTPGVVVKWTHSVNQERYDPTRLDEPQCPGSLTLMRREMIGSKAQPPDAMVAIGGMEGVEKEFSIFRELRAQSPVYVLPSTGGAAQILAETAGEQVLSFDAEVEKYVRKFRSQVIEQERSERELRHAPLPVDRGDDDVVVIPYANVGARIVEDIARRLEQR
jgi:hypothetical protein